MDFQGFTSEILASNACLFFLVRHKRVLRSFFGNIRLKFSFILCQSLLSCLQYKEWTGKKTQLNLPFTYGIFWTIMCKIQLPSELWICNAFERCSGYYCWWWWWCCSAKICHKTIDDEAKSKHFTWKLNSQSGI